MANGLECWDPDLRVHCFSTAGHWLDQQMPEQFNADLLTFLAEDEG
jgi:hypothetical protein